VWRIPASGLRRSFPTPYPIFRIAVRDRPTRGGHWARRLNYLRSREADAVLTANSVNWGGAEFSNRNLAILAGEQAAASVMPQIKAKLKAKQQAQ